MYMDVQGAQKAIVLCPYLFAKYLPVFTIFFTSRLHCWFSDIYVLQGSIVTSDIVGVVCMPMSSKFLTESTGENVVKMVNI